MPNKGQLAMQTLAAEQARKKSIELTKSGVLSMQLVINPGEPSPELSGEEEFSQWCWDVLEKNGVQDFFLVETFHLSSSLMASPWVFK